MLYALNIVTHQRKYLLRIRCKLNIYIIQISTIPVFLLKRYDANPFCETLDIIIHDFS